MNQRFSIWGNSALLGEHLTISEDIFSCHNLRQDAPGTERVEVRDAAEHPTVHGTALQTKTFSALNLLPLLGNPGIKGRTYNCVYKEKFNTVKICTESNKV